MKTWNIDISTQTRWLACGDHTADTFEAALEAAYEVAKAIKQRGEKFSGGVTSRLVRV